jgi:hypothetical protein
MKNNFLLRFTLLLLLTFLANTSYGQPPQFRAPLNQMYMSNQFRMQMQMMNMRGLRSTAREYDFVIKLRDSSTKKVTSAIYTDSATRRRFIVLEDKSFKKSDTNRYKKFFPAQTVSLTCVVIERNMGINQPGEYLTARLTDSCWMFKVITGAINVYSDDCDDDNSTFNRSSFVGIQLQDGPIVKYNEDNLKEMIGQDLNALEAIRDKNLYQAIKKYNRDKKREDKK